MDELQFPRWQSAIQEAILEFDCAEFLEKAAQAEALIFERLQELEQSSNGQIERSAIADGLSLLKKLKDERVRFS